MIKFDWDQLQTYSYIHFAQEMDSILGDTKLQKLLSMLAVRPPEETGERYPGYITKLPYGNALANWYLQIFKMIGRLRSYIKTDGILVTLLTADVYSWNCTQPLRRLAFIANGLRIRTCCFVSRSRTYCWIKFKRDDKTILENSFKMVGVYLQNAAYIHTYSQKKKTKL